MAVLDKVIQGIEHLFDGGGRVETVQLIEIDVIQLHASQALLHAADDVIAGTAAGVHPGGARLAKDFGRHHHVFTRDLQVLQRLAGDCFRTPF